MIHRVLTAGLLAALLSPAPAIAQQLSRVRVLHPNAPAVAEDLERSGHDIMEGSVQAGSFELVGKPSDLAFLDRQGFRFELLEVSQPFQDMQPSGDVPGYPSLSEVVQAMQDAETNYPAICQLVNLNQKYGMPQTFEGRDLYALKISDNVAQDEDEPNFLMVSAHHCREVVTPVIALDTISRLTTGYGSDPTITGIVDSQELWIAPIWNPDGYNHVFTVNNLWRKNRRVFGGGVGVDLNRNYPFGWSSPCAGSTSVSSETYKGPSPASEPETQLMMAFSYDRRFARVIDFHSYGRETLWGYSCLNHPLEDFLSVMGTAISQNSGYGGSARAPSAEGEHFEWQLATFGNFAFLTETHTTFQPSYASAVAEAALVWPGTLWILQRPISVSGHVTDVCTGAPIEASLTFPNLTFENGETASSGGPFGAYATFLSPGNHDIDFDAPGYDTVTANVTVTYPSADVIEVDLTRDALTLDIEPNSAALTDPVAFHTCAGTSGTLASLYVVDVSGIPFVTRVAKSTFDASGSWTLAAGIPNDPTLSGLNITFLSLGVDAGTGKLAASNLDALAIQ